MGSDERPSEGGHAGIDAADPDRVRGRDSAPPAELGRLCRVLDDERALHRLIVTFLEDCPAKWERIRAVVAAGDPTGRERAAHSLRGALTVLGADPAARAAEELERLSPDAERAVEQTIYGRLEAELTRLVEYLNQVLAAGPGNHTGFRGSGSGGKR